MVADGESNKGPAGSRDSSRVSMTVAEAARALGISESAVHQRVKRGELGREHTSNGQLIVYLDGAAAIATSRTTPTLSATGSVDIL